MNPNKPQLLLIFGFVAVFAFGWSANSRVQILYRCCLAGYEIQINSSDEVTTPSCVYFEIRKGGSVVKPRSFLGVQDRHLVFVSIRDKNSGFLAIYEVANPTVILFAFDTKTQDIWPDWDLSIPKRNRLEKRLLNRVECVTNRKGWILGDLTTPPVEQPCTNLGDAPMNSSCKPDRTDATRHLVPIEDDPRTFCDSEKMYRSK